MGSLSASASQLEAKIQDAIKKHSAATPKPSSYLPQKLTRNSIAQTIDHSALSPFVTVADIESACDEARTHNLKTVCVHPSRVELAAARLKGSDARPICVVGFPAGASPTPVKAHEARWSVEHGAAEVDMVVALGHLKAKEYAYVYEDIKAVVDASNEKGVPVKVILETGGLECDEIIAGCVLCKEAGAAFVKTSTGFGPGQATVESISLMRAVVGEDMGVKASGGVRDWEGAKAMLEAGADRIGARTSIQILDSVPT